MAAANNSMANNCTAASPPASPKRPAPAGAPPPGTDKGSAIKFARIDTFLAVHTESVAKMMDLRGFGGFCAIPSGELPVSKD
jgi:hypothetical protein